MKTAMFGGSFNPIHNGHIQLAQAFVKKLCLDRVLIIPTYIPPHKQKDNSVTPNQKLEMCRLAFEEMPLFEVSNIEIRRKGASYTYMTLQELSEKYKGDELFLITGADMFLTIHEWKHPEIIFSLATVCGVPRNDEDIGSLKKQQEHLSTLGAKTEILDANVMTVSSTDIRNKVKNGEDISTLVPRSVENYIKENGLYL
ncbi:MAG: nicotinate (nicotinamide) nucleotide adenylyltransferase [Clostridia bacterium]|nr:nicotinate (nicotinamide) nucleotide adenylyltransferase [Clostridia bacterium]